MAPILTQMQCNQIGTGLLGKRSRKNRVGVHSVPLLAQGGHVVDIDTQLDHAEDS
jgi:hypothetical protein